MTFRDWLSESTTEVNEHGISGVKWAYKKFLAGALRRVGKRINYGMNHLEQEWEVLVLLDACRPDMLEAVREEGGYDWLPPIQTRYSCASQSKEWIDKTLAQVSDEEAVQIGVVSGNGFTIDRVDEERFHTILNLAGRNDYWIGGRGLNPRPVTDHAIRLWRADDSPERMIVWYMQPHTPLPNTDLSEEFYENQNECDLARRGELSAETFIKGHKQNIRIVLDEVKTLLENLDSDSVVISADHAELLGEYGLYCHPAYVPLPALKRVPWVKTTAQDCRSRKPNINLPEFETSDLEDQLTALGYR